MGEALEKEAWSSRLRLKATARQVERRVSIILILKGALAEHKYFKILDFLVVLAYH
jgi:hypothetical protein